MSERTPRVAVIGAGLAGLAAARRLALRGDVDLVVYEAADRVGGVIGTSVTDGFAREHAANGFLSGPVGGVADLAEELGVPVEPASPAAKRRWVYRGGALRPVPSGPGDLLRGELLGLRGLVHALGEPFRPARQSGPEETVADFVRRRLGDEVLDALVAPFCTGVYAGDPEQLSLPAAFPSLAALEAEGGLVRGGAMRLVRRLLGHESGARRPRGRLASPRGGMAALIAALARAVGPRIQLGCPAVAIEVEAGGRARAVRLADGRREPFDAVVLAVPAPAAARLVSDASRELARLLDGIPYAGVAAVHLGYRLDGLVPAAAEGETGRLDGFGFLVARGEELRVLGAVFESVIWPSRAPADHVLIRCILGGVRDPGALELSDEELVARSHRDLERALGLAAPPVHRHVVRWPRAIAQYTVGHLERVGRAESLADGLGVVLAGASYHGVAVNSCTADATRVMQRVAIRLGLPPALGLLLALGLAAVVGLGAACSSGAKSGGGSGGAATGDAGGAVHAAAPGAGASAVGHAGPAGAAPATGDAEGDAPAEPPGPPGTVNVSVEWLSPPVDLVTAAGHNRCGAPRRPRLSIGALGGVEGAVVRLEGVPGAAAGAGATTGAGDKHRDRKGRDPAAEIAVRRCQLEPRAVRVAGAGGALALTSLDEGRRELIVDAMPDDLGNAGRLARVPLVLVGQRVEVDLEKPGMVRVTSTDDRESVAWVVVPDQPYVAVSDERGKVRFEDVPAGKYEVSVWHPPVGEKSAPFTARASIEVASGGGASATVSLAPARAAAPR
ncbi:MAG TPA: protoporphyrinogen oxidase [Kofleriaceae bacterium]|nr:protoporphyrinogen oxidase [Kofleriaceae bacterium]